MVVVPDLDLVVVTVADVEAVAQPTGSLLRRLVMETVAPAFRPRLGTFGPSTGAGTATPSMTTA